MAKNLLVCANAMHSLKKLNESESNGGGYFLEGVFAELDTLNRNKRIYPKEEYLKHLSYLRDDIKKGEPLLGELDHPDDRFEVKLKEASHRIVDLWYDADKNCVMGKIELLNTPNGKLAQSLVDQGIPLHISSRAAGTVGNNNKVSIQQIYTYDLVCKPGFAGAVLHRVNESEGSQMYNTAANRFLVESNKSESMNSAEQYGINNNEMSIREVSYSATLRKEAAAIKENDNDDMKKVYKVKSDDDQMGFDGFGSTLVSQPIFEDDENDDAEGDEKEDSKDDEKEDGVEIISVRADSDDDGVKIISVRAEDGSNDEDEDSKSDEEEEDNDKEEEGEGEDEEKNEGEMEEDESDDDQTDECGNSCGAKECGDKNGKCNGKECDPKKDALFDCEKIKKRKEKFEEKFEEFVNSHKRKEDKKKANESQLINKYPMFSMLSSSNLSKVMKLDESQKSKVSAYLSANNYCTPDLVNENWANGIDYEASEEVWLKCAPANYRSLYESAPKSVRESIRNTASYLLFENQYDVNNFWENTGLMESNERRIKNEMFINNMPKLNEGLSDSSDTGLGYSMDFIRMVTEMACEYND